MAQQIPSTERVLVLSVTELHAIYDLIHGMSIEQMAKIVCQQDAKLLKELEQAIY